MEHATTIPTELGGQERLPQYVQQLVDEAPPLTLEQQHCLRALLHLPGHATAPPARGSEGAALRSA